MKASTVLMIIASIVSIGSVNVAYAAPLPAGNLIAQSATDRPDFDSTFAEFKKDMTMRSGRMIGNEYYHAKNAITVMRSDYSKVQNKSITFDEFLAKKGYTMNQLKNDSHSNRFNYTGTANYLVASFKMQFRNGLTSAEKAQINDFVKLQKTENSENFKKVVAFFRKANQEFVNVN